MRLPSLLYTLCAIDVAPFICLDCSSNEQLNDESSFSCRRTSVAICIGREPSVRVYIVLQMLRGHTSPRAERLQFALVKVLHIYLSK
jgi:hypothetical protein